MSAIVLMAITSIIGLNFKIHPQSFVKFPIFWDPGIGLNFKSQDSFKLTNCSN